HTLSYSNGLSGNCNISGVATSTLSPIPNACGGNVTESWSATDACGNVISTSRVIHVSPAAAPVFASVSDTTVSCGGATTHTLSYSNGLSGNCNISGVATSTLSPIPNACGGNVTESWNATDACGNLISASRVIHVS